MNQAAAKKNACIIVNPISGGKDKKPVLEIIRKNFPSTINYEIIVWERPDQKDEIIRKIRERGYDIVIAAGGDGTINQVAQAILGSKSVMAILPLGSGNGLARHLNVPMNIKKALEVVGSGKEIAIDACTINSDRFFCTSGMGFDALVSKLFAKSSSRGLFTYFTLTLSNFFKYKPEMYQITVDGVSFEVSAFLITVANASQYGNDAFIAPQADIEDGYLDVVVLKPFKLWQVGFIASKIMGKTLDTSNYVTIFKGKDIRIVRKTAGPVHFDGEPSEMGPELLYTIQQGAVRVLVPA